MGKKLTQEEAEERFRDITDGDFKLLDKFKGVNKKHKIQCIKCGHIKEIFCFKSKSICSECRPHRNQLSQKEAEEKIKNSPNSKFQLVSEYRGSDKEVVIECIICGHKREACGFGSTFASLHFCAKCNATEKEKKFLKNRGKNFTIVQESKSANENIQIKCKICGTIKTIDSSQIRSSDADPLIQCLECIRIKKEKEVTADLKAKGYTLISKYIDSKTSYDMIHDECGRVWTRRIGNESTAAGCPECSIEKTRKMSPEEYKEKVLKKSKGEFEAVSNYKSLVGRVTYRHTNGCGKTFSCRVSSFENSKDYFCRICEPKNITFDQEHFMRAVSPLLKSEFKIIGSYTRCDEKLTVKHKCGYTYTLARAQVLIKKARKYEKSGIVFCPNCVDTNSIGEKTIEKLLKKKGIISEQQKRFKDCVNKLSLPFDFALYKNGELVALLEFDGIHHFEPVKKWGGEEYLKYVQNNDNIKNKYAKEIGIRMIRIPYFQADRLETILDLWIGRLYGDNNNNSVAA